MKFKLSLLHFMFCFLLAVLFIIPIIIIFYPIFTATSFIFPYAIYPFDICSVAPVAWKYMKIIYCISCFFVCFLISNFIYTWIFRNKISFKNNKNDNCKTSITSLHLYLGEASDTLAPVYLTESSLYQNILVTGTIGSGKTSSSMYPFTKQLIGYKACSDNEKLGMLILDVKGNFYKQVQNYAKEFNRLNDLFIIELGGTIKYNPLDKPNLKPSVLANRLKTVLTLFSPNNTESYWLDKAEEVLAECIKLCRLYNDGYVTFLELHKLVNSPNYYIKQISYLRKLFKSRQTYFFTSL